jgi:Protein of unknown function (DUF3562)
MTDQIPQTRETDDEQLAIELLAQETDTPVDTVHALYAIEQAKLEKAARITTYIPVLVQRRVKSILRARARAK